jgi:molybdopterin molybdotransferase
MLSFEEARRVILERVASLGYEKVELLDTLGRVLAEDVIAPWNLPSFDNSAMDGFAVRAAECSNLVALPVEGFIPAGSTGAPELAPGTAIRIMTGAMLPAGADAIVPIEQADESGGRMRPVATVARHQHVRFAGEDVRRGQTVLPAGTAIRPYEINILASCGCGRLRVVRRPTVAIVATGDELVALGQTPRPGQLVNSNTYALAAAVRALGAVPRVVGIARDNPDSHREKLSLGLEADALITSAGVSVGDRDLVRETLSELGVEIVFWKVRVKPGKALAFGIHNRRPVFALPGNPVSTMLSFEEFVAPALLKMMGHSRTVKPPLMAILQHDLTKKPGETHLVQMRLECANGRLLAWSAGRQATGIASTLLAANALAVLPSERESFTAGEEIPIHLLDGGLGISVE